MVREHAGRVAHAHIADTDRRPPGQGDWPLRAFLASLREGGYRGAVSIECHWQDLAAEAAGALAALREADGIPAAPTTRETPESQAAAGELVTVSPAPTTARTALISHNGGWCWFQDERALVDAATGTLLLGAVASTGGADGERRGGDVNLHVVDLDRLGEPGSARTVVLHEGLESDDHDNPALWRRADGRWVAVYSRHKSDDLARWRVSETADPTVWGEERALDWTTLFESPEQMRTLGGGRGVTYQNVHRLDGVLHCFVRAINDDPCYLVSHDDGETWQFGGRLLTRQKIGYVNGYARYASGTHLGTDDRIDLVITEHHPRDYATSIWHGYLAGGRLHRADGTAVGELGRGLAQTAPRAEDLTCVLASGSTWGGATMTHGWTTDLRRFADGTLVALMTARADDTLGTDTRRHPRHRHQPPRDRTDRPPLPVGRARPGPKRMAGPPPRARRPAAARPRGGLHRPRHDRPVGPGLPVDLHRGRPARRHRAERPRDLPRPHPRCREQLDLDPGHRTLDREQLPPDRCAGRPGA